PVATENTACGVPAAHQIRSNRRSVSSTTVGSSRSWPRGGMPPIANPVAARASSAVAGRPSRCSTRRSPAQRTIVTAPSTTKTSDFTIAPSSHPHASAASLAVRVDAGSSCTSTRRPRSARRCCTFAAVGWVAVSSGSMALLSVRNLTRRFGGIVAIDDVSLEVEPGQIVGLIGPNGAGKTTLFNVITRLYRPDAGALDFDGRTLLRTPPHRVVKRGISRTFQNVELFPTMTVLDNVLVGAHSRTRPFRSSAARAEALEILDYVGAADL